MDREAYDYRNSETIFVGLWLVCVFEVTKMKSELIEAGFLSPAVAEETGHMARQSEPMAAKIESACFEISKLRSESLLKLVFPNGNQWRLNRQFNLQSMLINGN